MNSITVTGRLTADPENKTGQGEQRARVGFSVADNHGKDSQGNDKVSYFRCTAWGKSAELILNSCKKGHTITVFGSFESRKYTDNSGKEQTSLDISVDRFGFGDSGQAPQQQQAPGYQQQQQQYQQGPQTQRSPQQQQFQNGQPAAPQRAQYHTDAAGNTFQLVNGQWILVQQAAPVAPAGNGAPPAQYGNQPQGGGFPPNGNIPF